MKVCERCGRELMEDWMVCPVCGTAVGAVTKPAKTGGFRVWKLLIVLLAVAAVALVGFAVYVALEDAGVFRPETPSKPSGGLELPSFIGDDTYDDLGDFDINEGGFDDEFNFDEEFDFDEGLFDDEFDYDDDFDFDDEVVTYSDEQLALLTPYVDAGSFDGEVYVNEKLGMQFAFGTLFPEDADTVRDHNLMGSTQYLYYGLSGAPYGEVHLAVDIPQESAEELLNGEVDSSEEWYELMGCETRVVNSGVQTIAGHAFQTCLLEAKDAQSDYQDYAFHAVADFDDVMVRLTIWSESTDMIEQALAGIMPYVATAQGTAAA